MGCLQRPCTFREGNPRPSLFEQLQRCGLHGDSTIDMDVKPISQTNAVMLTFSSLRRAEGPDRESAQFGSTYPAFSSPRAYQPPSSVLLFAAIRRY